MSVQTPPEPTSAAHPEALPTSPEPDGQWARAIVEPMPLRRKALIGLVAALSGAIVVALFALDAVVGTLIAPPPSSSDVEMVTQGEGPDCRDTDLPGEVSDRLAFWYGEDWSSHVTATGVPAAFPASAFAYAGAQPVCGNVFDDGRFVDFFYYGDTVSRTRFDAIATMLTAFGYVMTDDEVPHEPQVVSDGAMSGASDEGLAFLYRGFVAPQTGDYIWLALETTDLFTTSSTGALLFGYSPPG